MPVQKERIVFKNKFGRKCWCNKHFLKEEDKPKMVEVYNKINSIQDEEF